MEELTVEKKFLSSLYLRQSDANDKQSYREKKRRTRRPHGSPANRSTSERIILVVKVQYFA